jgi:hypothetical protein
MSEVYDLLIPWRDHEFWNLRDHEVIPNSIYVFGRQQFIDNLDAIRTMSASPDYIIVFANSAEGSSTLIAQLDVLGVRQLVLDRRVLLISGGDLGEQYPYVLHEHFLTRIMDYDENLKEMSRIDEIFQDRPKPYNFLFLNGRARPHRKYLLEKFRIAGLLHRCLWTMLDGRGSGTRIFQLPYQGRELMTESYPPRHLPDHYEVSRYRGKRINDLESQGYIKYELFGHEWGDIYLEAAPYIDTYFSVVTETVIDYPYSFRTEKIAKPLAQGHPWIAATNSGFYRDIRDLGFRTFSHLIDENFDAIENHQDRMNRIVTIVQDLCSQDLVSFIGAAESVCKYNQQHLIDIAPKLRAKFPARFIRFIEDQKNNA